MSVTTRPVPARTDLAHSLATDTPATVDGDRRTRRAGAVLAAGAVTWAAGLVAVGAQPETSLGVTIGDLSALPFQAGLFAVLGVMLRTGATGVRRSARVMIYVEFVLLSLATTWTVLHGTVPAFRDDVWLMVLDLFWPLSMLGMLVIGVKVAIAARWRGAARLWPLGAESWAVVTIPAMGALGPAGGTYVGAAHLLVGYTGLGLLLALRPQLTRGGRRA